MLDLGACVRDAKERLGYAKVVLAGWSGGGALSLYYQEQAEKPWVTATPAGDSPDLTAAGLVPADAVMLLAAHTSRHGVLTLSLDPSILDESDPDRHDPELDLYGANAPTAAVRPRVARALPRRAGRAQPSDHGVGARVSCARLGPGEERGFVVHGTMADPAILDVTIDHNDRPAGTSYLGDPRLVNNGPVGLARFCTLRSWLSQWSHDDALGDGLRAAAAISVPVLVIDNGADPVCYPSHATELYDAVGHGDKERHTIEGATHYYIGPGQRPKLQEAVDVSTAWLVRHDLAPASLR